MKKKQMIYKMRGTLKLKMASKLLTNLNMKTTPKMTIALIMKSTTKIKITSKMNTTQEWNMTSKLKKPQKELRTNSRVTEIACILPPFRHFLFSSCFFLIFSISLFLKLHTVYYVL